jgi:hypothetical protein
MRMMGRYECRSYWTGFITPDLIKVAYTFRKLLRQDFPGPLPIQLRHGDEISFGNGEVEDVERLGGGPLPVLCNLP